MREPISANPETGTTRQQPNDQPCSYHETLGCLRYQYERIDVKKKPVVKETPMAQVSWSTAEQLKRVSDGAFAIEAYRRGMRLVSVKNILDGRTKENLNREEQRNDCTINNHF